MFFVGIYIIKTLKFRAKLLMFTTKSNGVLIKLLSCVRTQYNEYQILIISKTIII